MDRKQARPQTAGAKTSNKLESAKKVKPAQMMTYQDYTIKQEKPNVLRQQVLTPKSTQMTLMKSTASTRPRTATAQDAYQFKQRVEQKFNNFLQKRDVIDDDDSLLQDSQQSRDRNQKAQILEQQQYERRKMEQLRKKEEAEKAQRIKDGLESLNKKVSKGLKQQIKKQRQSKSREKSRERSLQRRTAELVEKHRPDRSGSAKGAAAQLQDLKSWIEEQIKESKLDESNLEGDSDEIEKVDNNKKVLTLQEVGIQNEQQKIKILKHQLPGNSLLDEKEDAKLGSRQNRYGAFQTEQNEFMKVVEIQREKLAEKQPEPKASTPEPAKPNKEHVKNLIMQLAQKTGTILTNKQSQSKMAEQKPAPKASDNLSDDSCDKVPVKQTEKLIMSRPILNQKAQPSEQISQMLPGITDTKAKQDKLDKERKAQETQAVLVIQKFLRGHWGRRDAARQLYKRKNEIEYEFNRFQSEYKSSQDYNLRKYLKDKQSIRSKAGIESIDEIVEVIGESSSTNTAKIVQSSVQMQNFFKFGQQSTETDPLSIISIYAKRHSKVPDQNSKKLDYFNQNQKNQKKSNKNNQNKLTQSNSIIEEDIYSEVFDNEITEDIQKASSSASSIVKQRKTQKSKQIIESDSIIDEAPSAALSRSDSIADEVGDAKKDDSIVESSIQEDSIIRDEFTSDNYAISNAKKQLQAQSRVAYKINPNQFTNQPQARQETLIRMEEEKRTGQVRSQNLVGELLTQMREYETANMSQTMMDRIEKIVTSSLAQKDQIIMAQRLAELERENRHREEINRIREEQIRLMSQLMLLGNMGSGLMGNENKKQREDLINSIKSLAEQPIIIKEQTTNFEQALPLPEPMTHQQLYLQNQRTKITYLDEYDQSKRSNKFSSGKYSNDFQQDKSQTNNKFVGESRDDLSEDIVDEVGSVQSDSIVEEIEESESKTSGSFDEYKIRQYKLVQNDKNALGSYVSNIDKAINKSKEVKEARLNSQFRLKKISPRTYQRKRSDLEDWAGREKRDVRDKHQLILNKQNQQNQKQEQKSNLKKSLIEDSNDSDTVKQAINQTHLLNQGLIGVSADQKYIQRKKEAAERLVKEKEKVIQEQLNSKLRNLEVDMADEVLQQALELDVEKEVERRFQNAKRQLEENQGLESARSGLSQSKDSAIKPKKNVKFQDDQRKPTKQNNYLESSNNIEESIQESITDSYSQSFKSSSAIESKSKSMPLTPPKKDDLKFQAPTVVQQQVQQKKQQQSVDKSDSIAEMISDNYTDDFNNSDQHGESKQLLESKSKLQTKAKDLAESAAYSEDDFEEESLGQSQSIGAPTQAPTDKTKKMDSVLEESVDESQVRSKTSSRLESNQQQLQSEVPSEDYEVQESNQSIDWQIQVPQESARTGHELNQQDSEENKESIREDSSMNDRVEIDEFESNPEEIGRSASMSDDIMTRADRIAQELLEQILDEYKSDNAYIVSCEKKQIDEDLFKEKFPYTLDMKPVEPEPKPIPSALSSARSSASKPAKKQKTAKEIQDEAFIVKHNKEQKIIQDQQQRVADFLQFMIEKIDMQNLISDLDKPIELNPLIVLSQIQAYEDEEPQKFDEVIEQQQILPQTFFQKVDKEFHQTQTKNVTGAKNQKAKQEEQKLQSAYNSALFEAFNEALDQNRPYKNKGGPMPWSKNTRVVKQETSVEEARQIVEKAKQKVLEWAKTGAGSKYAPLPAPPTQTQDEFGEEIVQPPLQDGEEERRNQHRQEKLGQLMTQDIQETDVMWTDYEIEDTQVRFDLADMILAELASEIAEFLK